MVIKNDFGEIVGGPTLLTTYTFFFKNNTSIEAELNVKDIEFGSEMSEYVNFEIKPNEWFNVSMWLDLDVGQLYYVFNNEYIDVTRYKIEETDEEDFIFIYYSFTTQVSDSNCGWRTCDRIS